MQLGITPSQINTATMARMDLTEAISLVTRFTGIFQSATNTTSKDEALAASIHIIDHFDVPDTIEQYSQVFEGTLSAPAKMLFPKSFKAYSEYYAKRNSQGAVV